MYSTRIPTGNEGSLGVQRADPTQGVWRDIYGRFFPVDQQKLCWLAWNFRVTSDSHKIIAVTINYGQILGAKSEKPLRMWWSKALISSINYYKLLYLDRMHSCTLAHVEWNNILSMFRLYIQIADGSKAASKLYTETASSIPAIFPCELLDSSSNHWQHHIPSGNLT